MFHQAEALQQLVQQSPVPAGMPARLLLQPGADGGRAGPGASLIALEETAASPA